MYPGPFRYHRPETLAEVVRLLQELGPEAMILAGGQSLLPLMKLRMLAPADLVDLNFVPGLSYMRQQAGCHELGALVRHREVEEAAVPDELTILHDAARVIADRQVRTRGTVGGALCQADPAGDWCPVFLALDAEVEATGPDGQRTIAVRDFLADAYTTDLQPAEVLTAIRMRTPGPRSGGAYLALKQRAGDFAIASAAVQLEFDQGNICRRAGIALGSVGPAAVSARRAEELLLGRQVEPALMAEVVAAAMEACEPLPDHHGDTEYKRDVIGALVRRAIGVAVRRSAGERVEVQQYV